MAAPTPAPVVEDVDIDVEIVDAWCKGCDICVKICPERCLVLNNNEIVELAYPDACTGCRLCEWLCPDFAIAVHVSEMQDNVQGNHACALAAVAAGCRFYAGYPITPSSEVAERMSVELPKVGGMFIQMEDEIASMGAVLGASAGGSQGVDRHQWPRFFPEAGKPGLCQHDRNSLRDCQRDARRSEHGYAYPPKSGRCNAGTVGVSR